jgi:hypothetical protein
MTLIPCPGCNAAISSAASACPHCGQPAPGFAQVAPDAPYAGLRGLAVEGGFALETPVTPATLVDTVAAGELHAMAIHKLVLLDVFTLGFYKIFWFYRNWRRVRERTGKSLSPFWRSLFAPLWGFSFFDEVDDQARAVGVGFGWTPLALGLLYFALSVAVRLPDPWWLATILTVLVLVPVQHTINALAARRGVRPDASFQAKHIAVCVVGGIFLVLAVLGTLLPPE